MKRTELEVGDKIHIRTAFYSYRVQIVRVTKTQAIAKSLSGVQFELKFKRKVFFGDTPIPVSRDKWDNTERTVLTLNIPKEELNLLIK